MVSDMCLRYLNLKKGLTPTRSIHLKKEKKGGFCKAMLTQRDFWRETHQIRSSVKRDMGVALCLIYQPKSARLANVLKRTGSKRGVLKWPWAGLRHIDHPPAARFPSVSPHPPSARTRQPELDQTMATRSELCTSTQ